MKSLNSTAASLLGVLHAGPATGWELAHHMERSVGFFWNTTQSQVYRELKTLANSGLVETKAEDSRGTRYAITRAGRAAFAAWINTDPGPDIMRMPLVLSVFFGEHVEPKALRRFIRKGTLDHEVQLAEYQKLQSFVKRESAYQAKALELGIAYEELMIAWLEGLPWGGELGEKAALGKARVTARRAPLRGKGTRSPG